MGVWPRFDWVFRFVVCSLLVRSGLFGIVGGYFALVFELLELFLGPLGEPLVLEEAVLEGGVRGVVFPIEGRVPS